MYRRGLADRQSPHFAEISTKQYARVRYYLLEPFDERLMSLVEEIRNDPDKGAKRLDAEFRVGLTTLALRFCNDAAGAEDLVNRTFMEVCRSIDRYAEQSAFFAWMSKIMANIYANDIRRKSRQNEVLDGGRHETEPDPDAEAAIYRCVDAAILRDAIDTLPPDDRKAVVMHYFLDIPVREAARILSVPTGTFAWRLHNARMLLAVKLGALVKKPGVKSVLLAILAALFLAASAAVVLGGDPETENEEPAPETSTMQTTSETSKGEKTMDRSPVKSTLLGIMTAVGTALPLAAPAATEISVDNVVQRWPWNNKLDITYTVSGGQNVAAGVFARIVFTASIGATNITIDGVHDVGANAADGTHTVTWTLPPGLRANGCTMSAQLLSADNPSGDDYMVVDLDTGEVSYEGLLATQNDSNTRYNTATYKTDKMVLRKVPAGGPYPTGDNVFYSSGNNANSSTTWTTDRDYYVGVFPVTQYQYAKIGADAGSCPSGKTGATTGTNIKEHRPVEQVSWDDLRLSTTAVTSSIPAVASSSGTFFQRLNHITGNRLGFDLPTEVMAEIAERAGSTTTFGWGNTVSTDYIVCKENSGSSTVAVGSRLPNAWGLFDTAGNVWEWCLDDKVNGDLAARTDAFTPAWASGSDRRARGGGSWNDGTSGQAHRASFRGGDSSAVRSNLLGFRVSRIVD